MTSRLVGLDTCSVGHLLCPGPGNVWEPHLTPLVERAQKGELGIVLSEITIAECCKLKYADGREVPLTDAKATIGGFFRRKFVMRRSVTDQESWLAGEYKLAHHFKTCDALIAATCALAGVEILVTTDGCSNATKGKLLSVPQIVRPDGGIMKIRRPDKWEQP